MKFYKVICLKNKKFLSPGIIPTFLKQRYFKTKINKPKIKNSKIFVFNNLNEARGFRGTTSCSKYQIWEVELWRGIDKETILSYWNENLKNIFLNSAYKNTYLCDSIKFIKEHDANK